MEFLTKTIPRFDGLTTELFYDRSYYERLGRVACCINHASKAVMICFGLSADSYRSISLARIFVARALCPELEKQIPKNCSYTKSFKRTFGPLGCIRDEMIEYNTVGYALSEFGERIVQPLSWMALSAMYDTYTTTDREISLTQFFGDTNRGYDIEISRPVSTLKILRVLRRGNSVSNREIVRETDLREDTVWAVVKHLNEIGIVSSELVKKIDKYGLIKKEIYSRLTDMGTFLYHNLVYPLLRICDSRYNREIYIKPWSDLLTLRGIEEVEKYVIDCCSYNMRVESESRYR